MHTLSRIVAATDFSPAGRAALARAGQLAAQHGAELRIVHATPDWNLFSNRVPMAQQHYKTLCTNAERLLRESKDWLASEFSIHVIGDLQQGKASQAIARCVEMYQPGLLVMGAHGEHAPGGVPITLGATTLKLINRVKIPLLIVRTAEAKRYDTSLAAVGTSMEQARRIIHWAQVLTAGGDCHVVRAYEIPYLERLKLGGLSAQAISTCHEDAEMASRYAANPPWSVDEGGAKIHLHLVRGAPLPSVLSEMSRHAAQLVLVGRHEQTPLAPEHSLLGCIGTQIAYHSTVDVLVVT